MLPKQIRLFLSESKVDRKIHTDFVGSSAFIILAVIDDEKHQHLAVEIVQDSH